MHLGPKLGVTHIDLRAVGDEGDLGEARAPAAGRRARRSARRDGTDGTDGTLEKGVDVRLRESTKRTIVVEHDVLRTASQHALNGRPVARWAVVRFLTVGRSTADERPVGRWLVGRWLVGTARDSALSALVGRWLVGAARDSALSALVGRWLVGAARDSASSALVGVKGAFEAELLIRGLDELRLVPN